MQPSIKKMMFALVAMVMLGFGPTLAGAQENAPEVQTESATPLASAACRNTFAGGSGDGRFVWCFTNNGNITSFEHPVGARHLLVGAYVEGYTLCSGATVLAADNASSDFGWGVSTYPSGTKVLRSTTSGQFKLEQTFTQNPTEKIVSISMKLTNTGGSTVSNIRLMRHADFDVNDTVNNDYWFYSARSVTATDINQISLKTVVGTPAPNIGIIPFSSALPTSCTPSSLPQGSFGDNMAFATYDLGTLNPGQSKTVKFVYDGQL